MPFFLIVLQSVVGMHGGRIGREEMESSIE